MKIILILAGIFLLQSCSRKEDVLCVCYGDNNQDMYDLGVKHKPSAKDFLAQCDTMAVHNGLDSCQVWTRGR